MICLLEVDNNDEEARKSGQKGKDKKCMIVGTDKIIYTHIMSLRPLQALTWHNLDLH